ncbi:DciA family protein [Chitinimonas sp.]|uniref:DciA family protein n=1 Tax=Chitinimonas sp. TaxID=1934313 RepID=UPI0035B2E412
MATRPFSSLLESHSLARLNRLADAQRQLESRWQAALPFALQGLSRVIGVDASVLQVSARSQAVVAKLRQMEGRLLDQLNEKGVQVNAIRYRIQVELLPHEQRNPKRNLALSAAALDALQGAAQTLPPSSLRDALAELVAKRRPSSGSGQ